MGSEMCIRDRANTLMFGNTLGMLDSPRTGNIVQGALLHLDTVQGTFINNAMWTTHDVPVSTVGQLNLAWGALCAPDATFNSVNGPTDFIELDESPFSRVGMDLFLATNSPCIDQGNDTTADSSGVWSGRPAEEGTTRDIEPVDLGAHYDLP